MNSLKAEMDKRTADLEGVMNSPIGREVHDLWFVDLMYGHSKEDFRDVYVVRLQSKLNYQAVYLRNEWVHDLKYMDQILCLLNKFSMVKRSHIRYISSYIQKLVHIPDKILREIQDVDTYLPVNLERGVSAYNYYEHLRNHVKNNLSSFTLKSRGDYDTNRHEGVILTGSHYPFTGLENDYYVAIKGEVFRKLINVSNDREYRNVLENLHRMGALIGSLDELLVESVEDKTEKTRDSSSDLTVKRSTKKSRIGKRIRTGNGDTFMSGMILKVSMEWL